MPIDLKSVAKRKQKQRKILTIKLKEDKEQTQIKTDTDCSWLLRVYVKICLSIFGIIKIFAQKHK